MALINKIVIVSHMGDHNVVANCIDCMCILASSLLLVCVQCLAILFVFYDYCFYNHHAYNEKQNNSQ